MCFEDEDGIESRVIHALRKRVEIRDAPVEIEVRVEGKVVTIDVQAVFDAAMANVRAQIGGKGG